MWDDVVRKGHDNEAISNLIEEAETGHRSSLFRGLPVQLRLQCPDVIT